MAPTFSPNGSPRTFPPSDRQQRAPDTHINSFSSGPNLVLHSTALQCHSFFFVVFFFTILERGKKEEKKHSLRRRKQKFQKIQENEKVVMLNFGKFIA